MTTWMGPLEDVKILDFTRVLAGPFATLMLGDLGARIIKVEPPGKGDDTRVFPPHYPGGMSHYFMALNRNKRSIVIDLRTDAGRDIALRLADKADVIVENFRPGVMARLGIGYEAVAKRNPGIVFCSISGFGQSGPMAEKPSFDIVTQALSGAMSVNGELGGAPVKLGLPMGDLVGGIFGSVSILSALHERQRTGKGRHIDVSLLDGLMGMLTYLTQLNWLTGRPPVPVGSKHPNLVPYGAFEAADGHIVIACLTETFWERLAKSIGRTDMLEDPRFKTSEARLKNRVALDEEITKVTRQKTVAEWLKVLETADIPHAPILNVAQALESAHAKARGLVTEAEHPALGTFKQFGRPVQFVGAEQGPLPPPQTLGEDTGAVLRDELGLSAAEVARLIAAGAVAGKP